MIRVCGPRDRLPPGAQVIDTTTRSQTWSRGLSPMILEDEFGYRVENTWQYSKVYPQHWNAHDGCPTPAWWQWCKEGLEQGRAVRYPMGKGAVPVGSWWHGELLGYIDARKNIYVRAYQHAVLRTADFGAWALLQSAALMAHLRDEDLWLWDYDGYDHVSLGMSLVDVLNNPDRKMGHAFVLAYLLEESA